ncbi:MAG: hypothetical protein EA384_10915 [Spirochaetaceae bacterium]|nr:MAG: hypothetical protein EA384_10915 [Spirochaetaceae bacterium]
MSSYDFYIFLRSLDELLVRLMPLLVVLAAGLMTLFVLRAWFKRRPPERIDQRIVDLEQRVAALEERLPPPAN